MPHTLIWILFKRILHTHHIQAFHSTTNSHTLPYAMQIRDTVQKLITGTKHLHHPKNITLYISGSVPLYCHFSYPPYIVAMSDTVQKMITGTERLHRPKNNTPVHERHCSSVLLSYTSHTTSHTLPPHSTYA